MSHRRLPIALAAAAAVLAVSATGQGIALAAPLTGASSTAPSSTGASSTTPSPFTPSAAASAGSGSDDTAAAPANEAVSITVVLDPSDRSALRGLVAKAPSLTEAERARSLAAVAPESEDRHDVVTALRAAGFSVTDSGTWQIAASGTVAEAESFFDVELVGSGETLHPASSPRIPSSIASSVTTVLGLDQRPVVAANALPGGSTPADLASAYNATRSGSTGAGTTVATVQFSGWRQADLQQYASAAGLAMPSITNVQLGTATSTAVAGSGDVEVALDQEMLLATAPKAAQRIYFATNSAQGMYDAWNTLANDVKSAGIDTASTSWGICQSALSSSVQNAVQDAIARAVVNGATVFAASGDYGAYDCASTSNPSAATAADVSFPAVLPSVVGVGGTSLSGSAGNWSETTWSDSSSKRGSGGGVSKTTSRPSWQSGIGVSGSTRAVPDISATADPNKGVSFYASSIGGFQLGGGTSAAAPIMAGQLAATLSSLGCTTGVGDIHSALYANGSAFRDVTTGNNLLYSAGPGYDLATGLGSPNWAALAPKLPACAAPIRLPQGSLDEVSGTTSGVTVRGWAWDPDATGATSVDVWDQTSGGKYLASTSTSTSRSDVASAVAGAPGNTGYSVSVRLSAGTHVICAYGINVGSGTDNPLLGCRSVNVTVDRSHDPSGFLDAATPVSGGAAVSGWVFDPDASDTTSVDYWVDGAYFGRYQNGTSRPDVQRAVPGAPATAGFQTTIKLAPGNHTVCAYGINTGAGTGDNPLLGCKGVTVSNGSLPQGSFDSLTGNVGGISLWGWAWDADNGTDPLQVDVWDQTSGAKYVGSLKTGVSRPDVANAIAGATSTTGFNGDLPLSAGNHTVCAYAINAPSGDNPLLGCRAVTVR